MHTSAPGVDAAYAQQTLGKDRGYESQKPAPVRLLLCARMPFLACRVDSSAARQHCTRAQRGASQPVAACLYGCQPIPRPPGEMATPHPTTEIRLWIQVVLLRRPWHGVCAAAAACGSVHAGARPDACVCLAVARSRRALCAASDLLRLNHPALPVMSLRCGKGDVPWLRWPPRAAHQQLQAPMLATINSCVATLHTARTRQTSYISASPLLQEHRNAVGLGGSKWAHSAARWTPSSAEVIADMRCRLASGPSSCQPRGCAATT